MIIGHSTVAAEKHNDESDDDGDNADDNASDYLKSHSKITACPIPIIFTQNKALQEKCLIPVHPWVTC